METLCWSPRSCPHHPAVAGSAPATKTCTEAARPAGADGAYQRGTDLIWYRSAALQGVSRKRVERWPCRTAALAIGCVRHHLRAEWKLTACGDRPCRAEGKRMNSRWARCLALGAWLVLA